jgi:hypothetical protein
LPDFDAIIIGTGQYEIREHSVQAGEVVLSLLWWKDSAMVERFVH